LFARCLIEPASRALDAAIYCAVLGATDDNTLSSAVLVEVRASGFILNSQPVKAWVYAPWYTEDLASAQSLVPAGLSTISRDPRLVCATALKARAILNAPSLPLDDRRGRWLA